MSIGTPPRPPQFWPKNLQAQAPSVFTAVVDNLGSLIRALRTERGLTQRELAVAAGIHEETIAKVEQGRGTWKLSTGRLIFEALARAAPLSTSDVANIRVLTRLVISAAPEPPPAPALSPDTELRRLHDQLDTAVSLVGVRAVGGALSSLLDAARFSGQRREAS